MKNWVTLTFVAASVMLPNLRAAQAEEMICVNDAPLPPTFCADTLASRGNECYSRPKGIYGCWTHDELAEFVCTPDERFCSPNEKPTSEEIVLILLPYWNGKNRNCDDGVAIRRYVAESPYPDLCAPYCQDPANHSKPGCEAY